MAKLESVYPISDENTQALPVRDLEAGVRFYQSRLGFSVVTKDKSSAVVARDDVRIGLVLDPEHQPGKAGSVAFRVDDLDEMRRELEASEATPGKLGLDEWDGRRHRTFFVRESDNGYCFCFFCPCNGRS